MSLRDVFPGIPFVESPFFSSLIDELNLGPFERRIATELHQRGYAVIDFPDDGLEERVERIKTHLADRFDADMTDPATVKGSGHRVQDAWLYSEDIRAIAANETILDLLQKIYGRRPFPFQTLNFPVGTAQHLHSDSIHFSSIPERFMCGVWLAMEDVHPDAGPLTYLPGSHAWPILTNAMIGRRGFDSAREMAQAPFERAWDALVEHSTTKTEVFLARKGQALIWAANLLHGGAPQEDPCRTRWSQVTHYYFDDCAYYTPSFSDESLGLLDLRAIVDIESNELKPNLYLGQSIEPKTAPTPERSLLHRVKQRLIARTDLPDDFDSDAYYRLNPDVAVAKLDAATHYLSHGKAEGRRYRFRLG